MTPYQRTMLALETLERLTERDFGLLYRVGKGERRADIARDAGIKPNAVSNRLTRIKDKMGCATTEEACGIWGLAGQPSELPTYAGRNVSMHTQTLQTLAGGANAN